ncbi:concanavalin A-like lectin/glucanase domain-containing protein [Bisporella sp. PMI_857]|nr:concanavalin A-like lectin/glucanase domain-containing protein [Bisporella sp. PMI_857]
MQGSVLALALVSPATAVYLLDPSDNYSGADFFSKWDFITSNDPTGGFVDYLSQSVASSRSLIGYNAEKQRAFIGVDKTTVYSTTQTPTNRGRASIRIESKKKYTKGLFVADLYHVPQQACGIWPAFWTVSHDNYPQWGEIDIYENINENSKSLNVLHTNAGYTLAGNQGATRMTGTVNSYNCDDQATTGPYGTTQSVYQGCAATAPGPYGTEFNANGGGVVVMEWTTNFIKMWNFKPSEVPANIKSGTPDTASWGLPHFTTQGGTGTTDGHFKEHNIVFDITFCGTYAGLDYFWQQTSCYKSNPTRYPRCIDYVAANPTAFENAYWIINSVKVYKWT